MNNINKYITTMLVSLVLISFVISHLLYQQANGNVIYVEIYKNGQLNQRINLSSVSYKEIKVADKHGHYNVVEIKDGNVRVKEADCPNQTCVKTGWLSNPGQISFCAPNKLKVVIKGKTGSVDTTAY